MKNQIANFYITVLATVEATRDAPAERLQSVRQTASLLCNRMAANIDYCG